MTDLLHLTENLLDMTLILSFIGISASLVLLMYQIIKGPPTADSAVALDSIGINLMGVAALFAILLLTSKLNDVVLLIDILSLLVTIAIATSLERAVIMDRDID